MYPSEFRQFHFDNYTDAFKMESNRISGPNNLDICYTEIPRFILESQSNHFLFTRSHTINWFYYKGSKAHYVYVLSSEHILYQYKTRNVDIGLGIVGKAEVPSLELVTKNTKIKDKAEVNWGDKNENEYGQFFYSETLNKVCY